MKNCDLTKPCCAAWAAAALMIAATLASAGEPRVSPKQPATEAPPEIALVGQSAQEILDQQLALYDWLIMELPAGALDPLDVRLTDDELTNLAIPDDSDGPLRVGLVKAVEPALQVRLSSKMLNRRAARGTQGTIAATDDGGFIWARTIRSPGATGLRIHFTDFSIPADADVYVIGDYDEAYGPYQRAGRDGTGEFWSDTVMGSDVTVVVRHFGPNGSADLSKVRFTINEIGHIGPLFLGSPGEGNVASFCQFNSSCVENAMCSSVSSVTNAKSAVAKMLWVQGCCLYTCSGGLMADTDTGTQIPYFLTANHCLNKSNSNIEAFFKYQVSCGTSNCTATFTDPPSSLISGKTVGATIMSTGSAGDFSLFRLNQNPPAGSVFLGWNSNAIANTNGAALHRISHPSGAPQAYSSHTVNTSKPTCQGWPRGERIYSHDNQGATEGGSSGSPVVNASGQVVGQLSGCCGFNCGNECDANNNATVDGALAYYFSSVAQYLDPGTGGCTPSTEVCNDGVDNDCDGATDCADSNCSGDPNCGGGSCGQPGASCTSNSDCCSNSCKGRPNNKTCR